jgi:hypothetical protein
MRRTLMASAYRWSANLGQTDKKVRHNQTRRTFVLSERCGGAECAYRLLLQSLC